MAKSNVSFTEKTFEETSNIPPPAYDDVFPYSNDDLPPPYPLAYEKHDVFDRHLLPDSQNVLSWSDNINKKEEERCSTCFDPICEHKEKKVSGDLVRDGIRVLKKIIELLPIDSMVKKIAMDFESALWIAFRGLLPNVKLQLCLFYWTQALWWKIQELGLQTAYSKDDAVYKYLRKLMAVPFLPHNESERIFGDLCSETQQPMLRPLLEYIQKQWIESQIFPPINWSVYQQSVRTNNDIEGWHNALNKHAGNQANINLYLLIEILEKEAQLTAVNVRFVSERKLKRIQRKKYKQLPVQENLFSKWEQYKEGHITSAELLRFCSHLNDPARG